MSISKQGTGRINVCRRYQTGSLYDLILSQSNGLIILSDLFNDKYTGKTTGGFVVYYVSGSKGDVTAFKPVSNNAKSSPSHGIVQKSI